MAVDNFRNLPTSGHTQLQKLDQMAIRSNYFTRTFSVL